MVTPAAAYRGGRLDGFEGSLTMSRFTKYHLRRSTTSFALLGPLLGTGIAPVAAAPAHAAHDTVTADAITPPGLQGFLPLAEVGKAYSGDVLMRYRSGSIVSVTIDHAKLPPGLTAQVNPDDAIRVSGTTTGPGRFELAVSMTGLSTDGEIVTGSSSRELIVSTAVRIDRPAAVAQGIPVSTQLPLDYSSGKIVEVNATAFRTACRCRRPA